MNNISKQIELVQDAYSRADDALALFTDATKMAGGIQPPPPPGVRKQLLAAMSELTVWCEQLDKTRKALRSRFNCIPVLQATISANGKSVRVAVAKPIDGVDEPWITEKTRDALMHRLNAEDKDALVSMEDFPVLVVGRSCRVVAEIGRAK